MGNEFQKSSTLASKYISFLKRKYENETAIQKKFVEAWKKYSIGIWFAKKCILFSIALLNLPKISLCWNLESEDKP